MSRRSESARRRDAVGFHQRSTTFIDNYKPIGAAALLLLGGTYQAYDLVHKTRERKLKWKIVQNEWNVSQNTLYASNEDLKHKKYMNQKAKENVEFEQRHRLDEIGYPEWGRNYTATAEYSSYPVERYQEPQQWQPWERKVDEEEFDEEEVDEEEVDERSWYEKKEVVRACFREHCLGEYRDLVYGTGTCRRDTTLGAEESCDSGLGSWTSLHRCSHSQCCQQGREGFGIEKCREKKRPQI